MITIAIPVFGSRISGRLDTAEYVLLVTVENNQIKEKEKIRFVQKTGLEKVNMLIQFSPDVIICGGLTEICSNRLLDSKIKTIPWIQGEVDKVLISYLQGKLNGNVLVNPI
jgi:predicted Fe-Mo cluster-binding NifX family protein